MAAVFICGTYAANSVSSHFGSAERQKFKNVFSEAISTGDAAHMYYAIEGYRLLNEIPKSTQESCKVWIFIVIIIIK